MNQIKKQVLSYLILLVIALSISCKKKDSPISEQNASLSFKVDGIYNGSLKYTGLPLKPIIEFTFDNSINLSSTPNGIILKNKNGDNIPLSFVYQNENKIIVATPQNDLASISTYTLEINNQLQTTSGGAILNPVKVTLSTAVSDNDKFSRITDDELLTLIQKQTFKYFWDFGHPTSGLARERNTSANTVTSGGSGFGIMAMIVAANRSFVSKADVLTRLQKIVTFLKTADRFHGAYPHWLDGNTGKVIPFSTKDNGGDLVETSFLIAGLITAKQYFNSSDAAELTLRNDINSIVNTVEWNWYRQNDSNTLYWHWSPNYNWEMNLPIKGWNECLITYVLAAASTNYTIPKSVYDTGWAQNGAMKNGNSYYGTPLPLGSPSGGPLFFSHYSFLGINPLGLTDAYANYETQNKAHAKVNFSYCKANPLNHYGYSENCWGLTASDIPNGYTASSPTNDVGVIAPTAALSSLPYTPTESMQAIRYFYYKLGDKMWGEYGFYDSFSLKDQWFANSTLAIDQGPIIVMIENHRNKLIWNLFMSAPEVKSGLQKLGFSSPNL